jgi:hypothetical protein
MTEKPRSGTPGSPATDGREELVATSNEALRRPEITGQALIDLLHGSPLRDLDFESEGARTPVRDVNL